MSRTKAHEKAVRLFQESNKTERIIIFIDLDSDYYQDFDAASESKFDALVDEGWNIRADSWID